MFSHCFPYMEFGREGRERREIQNEKWSLASDVGGCRHSSHVRVSPLVERACLSKNRLSFSCQSIWHGTLPASKIVPLERILPRAPAFGLVLELSSRPWFFSQLAASHVPSPPVLHMYDFHRSYATADLMCPSDCRAFRACISRILYVRNKKQRQSY